MDSVNALHNESAVRVSECHFTRMPLNWDGCTITMNGDCPYLQLSENCEILSQHPAEKFKMAGSESRWNPIYNRLRLQNIYIYKYKLTRQRMAGKKVLIKTHFYWKVQQGSTYCISTQRPVAFYMYIASFDVFVKHKALWLYFSVNSQFQINEWIKREERKQCLNVCWCISEKSVKRITLECNCY